MKLTIICLALGLPLIACILQMCGVFRAIDRYTHHDISECCEGINAPSQSGNPNTNTAWNPGNPGMQQTGGPVWNPNTSLPPGYVFTPSGAAAPVTLTAQTPATTLGPNSLWIKYTNSAGVTLDYEIKLN